MSADEHLNSTQFSGSYESPLPDEHWEQGATWDRRDTHDDSGQADERR